ISIEGQKHVSEERIVRAIKIKTGYPIFLVSLENLKSRLENIEWIKNVFVERKLPNNITIYIEERTPIALGQRDNKLYLIDNEGVIIHE
ncbi:MAG: FtsQ-type POTRA domain-containing protein, partial [Pseudomonadota bacterium]